MSKKTNIPNKRTLRVSKVGDKELREMGWVSPDNRDMPSIRHHADLDHWIVLFPLLHGFVPLGSASTIREAYREAYRQYRLMRRKPERMARGRSNALRAAWRYRQRARRYADTVNQQSAQIRALRETLERQKQTIENLLRDNAGLNAMMEGRDLYERSLIMQLDEAKQQIAKLNQTIGELKLAHNRLQHEADYFRRRQGLPTSEDLKAVGNRPVYPLRSQSEPMPEERVMGDIRIHAALLPPGVSLDAVIAAIEVLPATAPETVR